MPDPSLNVLPLLLGPVQAFASFLFLFPLIISSPKLSLPLYPCPRASAPDRLPVLVPSCSSLKLHLCLLWTPPCILQGQLPSLVHVHVWAPCLVSHSHQLNPEHPVDAQWMEVELSSAQLTPHHLVVQSPHFLCSPEHIPPLSPLLSPPSLPPASLPSLPHTGPYPLLLMPLSPSPL